MLGAGGHPVERDVWLEQRFDAPHLLQIQLQFLGDLFGGGLAPQLQLQLLAGLLQVIGARTQPPRQVVHAAQLVQHGAANAVLDKGLERHPAAGIETLRRLQQSQGPRRPQVVEGALQTGAHGDAPGHPIDQGAVALDQLVGIVSTWRCMWRRRGACSARHRLRFTKQALPHELQARRRWPPPGADHRRRWQPDRRATFPRCWPGRAPTEKPGTSRTPAAEP